MYNKNEKNRTKNKLRDFGASSCTQTHLIQYEVTKCSIASDMGGKIWHVFMNIKICQYAPKRIFFYKASIGK